MDHLRAGGEKRNNARHWLLDVAEHESIVTQDCFSDAIWNRRAERRSFRHECVEFAALAAWIYSRGKIGEKLLVEQATREGRVELGSVNADETRDETIRDEPSRQAGRVESPDRKERLESAALQQALSIRAHVLEKKIAERDVGYVRELAFDFFKSYCETPPRTRRWCSSG